MSLGELNVKEIKIKKKKRDICNPYFLSGVLKIFVWLRLWCCHKKKKAASKKKYISIILRHLSCGLQKFGFVYVPRQFWFHLEVEIKALQSHKQASICLLNCTRKHWKADKESCCCRAGAGAPQRCMAPNCFKGHQTTFWKADVLLGCTNLPGQLTDWFCTFS